MIDFHTHILPDIDDGAKNETESCAMLNKLNAQGITTICLTSHYVSYKEPLEAFLFRRTESFDKIKDYAGSLGLNLLQAAEVCLTKEISGMAEIEQLCVEGTRLLLVEVPSKMSVKEWVGNVENLVNNFDVKPVIAHIERYPKILNNNKLLNYLLKIGCLMQVNLESFDVSRPLKKRKLFKRLREGKIHFVGTDCHGLSSRPPEYNKYIEIIRQRYGDRFVKSFERKSHNHLRFNKIVQEF